MSERKKLIIVGAGFGGLRLTRLLGKQPVDITLIDKRNHHIFQPLLYQVATAGLSPGDIAYPIRSIVHSQKNTRVILGEVADIDRKQCRVILRSRNDDDHALVAPSEKELSYDYLVVATGVTHSYFGNASWAEAAPGLKSIEDALEIRRRVLLAFEAAELETDEEERKRLLTFVIVGAGPTGVELAGAVSEIALTTMARDFRSINSRDARVVLVEAQENVLPSYADKLRHKARKQLESLGVEVRSGVRVQSIDEREVILEDETIPAATTLWAAGVAASPLGRALRTPLDSSGRVLVRSDLSIPGDPEVFVIGDLASVSMTDDPDGKRVPGVAPAAVQGADHVAKILKKELKVGDKNKRVPRPRFRYRNKGELATIGRASAVADLGRFTLSGFPAWVLWWAVHIAFLIGFRSKILVMFGWIWSYLSFGRGARLITDGNTEKGSRTNKLDKQGRRLAGVSVEGIASSQAVASKDKNNRVPGHESRPREDGAEKRS